MFIACFCMGVIYLLFFHAVVFLFLTLCLLLVLFGCLVFFQYEKAKLVGCFIVGLLYAALIAQQHGQILPKIYFNKVQIIQGVVSSIPKQGRCMTSFRIKEHKTSAILMLSHYGCDNFSVNPGQQWQLLVKLKPVHGLHNPGGFNLERWAFANNIKAKGYVKDSLSNQLINQEWYSYPLTQLRYYLYKKIMSNERSHNDELKNSIASMTIGVRTNLSTKMWALFRNTGTSHLIAISGLHVGIVSGFIYLLFLYCAKWILRGRQWAVSQDVAMVATLIAAWGYSLLAGLSLPTLRAVIMLSVLLLSKINRVSLSAWKVWWIAMFICLLVSPLQIVSSGFWLSFFAVAWLIYCLQGRVNLEKGWKALVRAQFIVILGLLPLSLFFFGQFSFISPVANLIAVPYVSFVVIPIALTGVILLLLHVPGADLLLQLSSWCLHYLIEFLQFLSVHMPWQWYFSLTPGALVFLAMGFVLLFAPRGVPGKCLGLLAFIPLFYKPNLVEEGNVRLTMLDVGQGLSMVVQTHKHVLIYDTGERFLSGGDMGQMVVIPYLHSLGIRHVNTMIISHGDNDHIGGAQSILHAVKVGEVLTSVPKRFSIPNGFENGLPRHTIPRNDGSLKGGGYTAKLCLAGESWKWDGVSFDILYPDKKHLGQGNNSSCVLKVTAKNQSMLLVGDIEKPAEVYLVKRYGKALHTDILQVAHHGSKTSSSVPFIKSVNPRVALFSYGFQNRYHFPSQVVVGRYRKNMTEQLSTVDDGAIIVPK